MPKLTLVSNAVAYNLYTLLKAADAQTPYSCAGLQVQMPDSSIEAANLGGNVKVGGANAGLTDVTNPELVLIESDSGRYPDHNTNSIGLREKFVKGSVNNAVIYVNVEVL